MKNVDIQYTSRALIGVYGGKPVSVSPEFAERMMKQGVARVVGQIPEMKEVSVSNPSNKIIGWIGPNIDQYRDLGKALGFPVAEIRDSQRAFILWTSFMFEADKKLCIRLYEKGVPYVLFVDRVLDRSLWDRQLVNNAVQRIFIGKDIKEEYLRRYGDLSYSMSDDKWSLWRALGICEC